jgi:diguanylate cyclase (GGDEF)-like protein
VLAFIAVATMAGLCGLVGLVYLNRITAISSVFSDVTSPLLTESVALVDNAQRTRSLFYAGIESDKVGDGFAKKFSDLHSESHARIDKLEALASLAGTNLQLDLLELHEDAFHTTLAAMLEASARKHSAEVAAQGGLAAYDAGYHKLARLLVALSDRADGRMMQGEDETKVQIQTGTATVDALGERISDLLNGTYPVVQALRKLRREFEEIDDTVRWLMQVAAPDQLLAAEQRFKISFRRISAISKGLGSRLREPDAQAIVATLQRGFEEIEGIILVTGGLFDSYRAAAMARSDIANGRQSFDRDEKAYFSVLDSAEAAVRDLNHAAKVKMENELVAARLVASIVMVLTIVIGLVFSLLFAHRLTKPLLSLTAQVSNIRASGNLKALPDEFIVSRNDEIGTLSRGFNMMIAELAAAREQLIATSEAEINKQYERLDLAINSMPLGLCMFDGDQKLIVCNRRYVEMYGLSRELSVPGTSLGAILRHRESTFAKVGHAGNFADERLRGVKSGKPWHLVQELSDGRAISIVHLPLPGGGSIATHEDISERRNTEAKMAYMAHHDMLTKLPNRVSFRDDMQKAVADLRERTVAVLCLDLDYFKNVNDTLGHPVGDALLKAVAARLELSLRPSDKVARLGGDEFAVVQVGVAQPDGSTALATRLIKEMAEPFNIDGYQVVIGTSIGISLAPNDGRDSDRLLKNADMALYRAKEDGRGTYRFFEPEMDARMQTRRTLELDMRKALVLGEFSLNYQPLVNLKTGEISCCEALMRWRHPQRGMITPATFIPLAEEIGFINPLGIWALNRACTDAQGWPDHVKLAVNLSSVQFKSGTLVADVAAALKASGFPANRLELEITESVLLNETDATLSTLKQLRELGVHISMDDFGTGYSSLGYLRKFPFDKIKIDQSFVRDLAVKPDSIAIIRAVAGLANTLGITTTVEGVETEAQFEQITKEGCTEAQGFLFSRPVTAEVLVPILRQHAPCFEAVA